MEQITLNKIASDIAGNLDKPFDVRFIERIKFAVLYWRAELIRRDSEKNNISKEFLNKFVTNLIDVDIADSCLIDIGCKVKRTQYKIPRPIRQKDVDSLFPFLGSADGKQSFSMVDMELLDMYKHSKYTNKEPRVDYTNGYLYVYDMSSESYRSKIKYIRIHGVFFDPRAISEIMCDDEPCWTDDDELPIGSDMVRTIIEGITQGKLRLPDPDEEEIKVSEDAETRKR